MIRHSPALAKTQEFAQRQAVRATPFQPTLAVDAFKVADQQHTEVASRRQRWTAEARRIVQGTLRLDEPIETCRDQNRLQLVVEGVAWRAWHLSPRHQHVRLAFPLPSKSHPPPAVLVRQPTNQIRADFVNGLLSYCFLEPSQQVRHRRRLPLPTTGCANSACRQLLGYGPSCGEALCLYLAHDRQHVLSKL